MLNAKLRRVTNDAQRKGGQNKHKTSHRKGKKNAAPKKRNTELSGRNQVMRLTETAREDKH